LPALFYEAGGAFARLSVAVMATGRADVDEELL
jgi:hypothetical protein